MDMNNREMRDKPNSGINTQKQHAAKDRAKDYKKKIHKQPEQYQQKKK